MLCTSPFLYQIRLYRYDKSLPGTKLLVSRSPAFIKSNQETYFKLLNAGFILCKPRLRLSHDLVLSRESLADKKVIVNDGSFEEEEHAENLSFEPNSNKMFIREPIKGQLPKLIQLKELQHKYITRIVKKHHC